MKFLYIKSKKKYIVKLALLTIPLVPIISSCKDDFLEAAPQLTVSDATAFDTPDRVVAQVNGLYEGIKNGQFLAGRYQIFNDVRAEEFINRGGNNVTALSVWNHTTSADDSYLANVWSRGYNTINRANVFLQGLEENAAKVDAEDAQHYRGEAKFIRALSYLSLVQVFAKPYALDNGASPGLPLRLQAETTTANNDLARSTVAEVYAQILKDLNDAENDLPVDYGNADLNTSRAHKSTAIALKTRVYLVMKQYADVITEANKIVSATAPFIAPSGVPHQLQADIATVFTNYTTTESIFSLAMSATSAPGTQNQLGYYYNIGNLEYFLNVNAPGIYANPQWGEKDARRTKLTDVDEDYGPYLTKYSGESPYIDWVPVIRYSEVLLNLAEAEAEVGSQQRARALLEAVHHRSDPTYDFGTLDQQGLINAILTERRIELLGEGFRSNDILRRGGVIHSVGAKADIGPDDQRYIFQIPTTERNSNGAI